MSKASSLTLGSVEGLSLSQAEKFFIVSKQPAGVTLFSRNIEDPKVLKDFSLTQELQELSPPGLPFIVAVDQEGGRVARFKHKDLDPGRAFSLLGGGVESEALSALKAKAHLQGKSLLSLGFNVNFAPVIDIGHEPEKFASCSIGDRAFASYPEGVCLRASAFLSGLSEGGVFGCLKHFPGIGKVSADTHYKTAYGDISKKTLWEENLVPFVKMHSQAQLIMVGHCIFPQICPLEASRSKILITDILRKELGYEGLILCDDLTMQAAYDSTASWEEYVIESIAAGCDMLLICSGLDRWQMACDALELEAKKSPAFQKRVDESFLRIQKFRQKLPLC